MNTGKFEEITEKRNGSKHRTKDYKKISEIKTAIFLILAAAVLAGMYFKERPAEAGRADPEETVIIGKPADQNGDTE